MSVWHVYVTFDGTEWKVRKGPEYVPSYVRDGTFYIHVGQVEAEEEEEAMDLAGMRFCGVEP